MKIKLNRQLLTWLGSLSLSILGLVACDNNPEPMRGSDAGNSSQTLSLGIPNSTSKKKVVGKQGEAFFLNISASKSWAVKTIPAEAQEWIGTDETKGNPLHDYNLAVWIAHNSGDQREALIVLESGNLTDTLSIVQQGLQSITNPTEPTPTPNTESGNNHLPIGNHILGDPLGIEIPRLSEGSNNYFVSSYAGGKINYSIEYDVDRRAPRWAAFTFDSQNSVKKVSRSDAWAWNPQIPEEYSTDNWFAGSGYSRGHVVASEDRVSSEDANRQTFYYTNMYPQLQSHNGGIWLRLEQRLQAWGKDDKFRDIIYVTKGATIRDGEILDKRIKGKMVIPKFFWMAALVKKGDSYKAIAFWTEHREYNKTTQLSSLAISIDELEKRTGLDLYTNLSKAIQDTVEAKTPILTQWPGL